MGQQIRHVVDGTPWIRHDLWHSEAEAELQTENSSWQEQASSETVGLKLFRRRSRVCREDIAVQADHVILGVLRAEQAARPVGLRLKVKGSMQHPVSDFVAYRESVSPLVPSGGLSFLQARADLDPIPDGPHPSQDLVSILMAKNFLVVEHKPLLLREDVKQHRLDIHRDGDVPAERPSK